MNKAVAAAEATGAKSAAAASKGMLDGVRVIEIADESAEYCGLLLAGLGADVIKIEPPGGSATRRIGPFFDDEAHPDRSLHFWNYNRGKKSVILDLAAGADRNRLLLLLEGADVLLDSTRGGIAGALGMTRAELLARFPGLVLSRMTPFGDAGPWKDYAGSDLVHLALGGVMMNCGYDPDPDGRYELAPIAPQAWQAYHIAGEQLAIAIVAALLARRRDGKGQDVSCAIHDAVAKNTELDLMYWVMRRVPLYRQTGRHAREKIDPVPTISQTSDGRWFLTWIAARQNQDEIVDFFARHGFTEGVREALPRPPSNARPVVGGRDIPGTGETDERAVALDAIIRDFTRSFTAEDMPWREAQDVGLLWSPLRKPHEAADDPHWLERQTLAEVDHPELGRSFRYVTSKWLSNATAWQVGRRAPLLGEDTTAVLGAPIVPARVEPALRKTEPLRLAANGKPFALQNIRILDFSWFLASAGGTRFMAGLGAECLKVEWKGNPDTRFAAMAPVGGRAARAVATGPLPGETDPSMGGQFNNKNSGKRGFSLNIKHPRGLDIAKRLVAMSDVVAEGFSPGVLERLGLGYDVMRQIKPDIIYVQQSGMGTRGSYGRMRTVGPVAAAFAGVSEMSGMPEPAMPTGWGYSFLDWMGAYGFALATLGALYHRERTGEGQWIDSSQCESGIFLNGTAILDWSVNGRVTRRTGNRSLHKPAAPHGAFRCAGTDRWLAIACFTETEWMALANVAGRPQWLADPRFATLDARLANQDALETEVTAWTSGEDAFALMHRLQAAGVPAGVCQTAQDKIERDPQLAALDWLTEVTGTRIGRWPVAELPMKFSRSTAHIGGVTERGAPMYGEDNVYVLRDLLGFDEADIRKLAEEDVI
ncbi:CaiB/BaiF CoA-transferase family protein [Devosia sp. Root635]|uniref:CaiB/BaiF CoA-transferase family protein n=1 Tax=Devosia sp. Root635 TaxID=1736575 RepID=UPI000AC4C998|nr:CoA transferase [Devosia sp. Root635]